MHCILTTNINICRGENTTRRKNCQIFASADVFQPPNRRISRRWTRNGTNVVIFLEALYSQTNLFWREMKIKKMYLKSNTRRENSRTFEERDVLNKIKSDQLPAKKTSLRGIVLPVKILCVLSWGREGGGVVCYTAVFSAVTQRSFVEKPCVTILKTAV